MTRTLIIAISLEITVSVFLYGKSLAAAPATKNKGPPALFAFGDSMLDTGNNNDLLTALKCNFRPYGRDFMGGKPTGRFCNGRVPSDFLAELLGLKKYLPAYLDKGLKTEDLLTGVGFASGATGYDPLTSQIASVISMPNQLNLFKQYKRNITAAVGQKQAAKIVAQSTYVMIAGNNDIANTYFSTPFRRVHYDVPSYTDLLIDHASSFFMDLYGQGSRKIAVLSMPPIGCVPSQRTLDGGLRRECSERANEAALLFNSKLSPKLKDLSKQLPGSRFVYMDVYNTLLDIFQNHTKYGVSPLGFEVGNKGCCGTGNIEASILCNRLQDTATCKDDTKYVFWDSLHLTERAYEILSNETFNKYKNQLL
ncbi:GDSL esterase/lipase EXL3-like isoform X3 [Punica granatum]|uniref:GDSL esterase/lipase EXL3-like isoform X3 n=1 Tax=Punica granatum TaxID=22663 RepID=A0A6P8CSC8_PUNGR|nr:GDSL esterase/lipase EXL3-like isoform X3 [Punica granatum]